MFSQETMYSLYKIDLLLSGTTWNKQMTSNKFYAQKKPMYPISSVEIMM
jgi:hypothetical protein